MYDADVVESQRDDLSVFRGRSDNRYWWFQQPNTDYIPPVFSFLTGQERALLLDWFQDTDRKFSGGTGECNIPAISAMQGFIMGNGIRNIVQLGHFIGYSTLLIGFMMRRMGFRRALWSVDIDPAVSDYTKSWLRRAELDDYVSLVVADSAAPHLPQLARDYFGGNIQIVFIDSSHAYRHTLAELELWYPAVCPGGLLFLHDVSAYAASFDASGAGGVHRAVVEWLDACPESRGILLNVDRGAKGVVETTYLDGCGLGIIQKPGAPNIKSAP